MNIDFEDDQLFYCQSQNQSELFDIIIKSYIKVAGRENIATDMEILDDMKDILNSGQYSYFVIEKIQYQEFKETINGQEYKDDNPSGSFAEIETKKFIIVASQDHEFQKHFHLLHKQDKFSAYSIQKTIEKRMDTIIYRAFKDIIRQCNYQNMDQQTKQYPSFYSILTSEREQNQNFFHLNNKQISLDEIKSIVYKNMCIEGLYPFNIYLNTFKENYGVNRIKWIAGKLLSDNSYKFTHHLCMQVGNIFYSYNDSGVFTVYRMQQKERFVQKSNDFTKIRVLDFFPLDQQVDEISVYIQKRLDIFNEQLHYFFNPQMSQDNEFDELFSETDKELQNLKDELNIDKGKLNNQKENEIKKQLIEDCEDILSNIKQAKICNLTKERYNDFIKNIKNILKKIKTDSKILEKIDVLTPFNDLENEEATSLCKSFLKFILTNNQVNHCDIQDQFSQIKVGFKVNEDEELSEEESKSMEIQTSQLQHSSKQMRQGDGGAHKLLLRRLGYSFLSHYYGEFKYFHCWPVIISEIEVKKYSAFNNNCQTAGILLSYQIKEQLKEYIEPLFISEQKDFFEFYHNYFEQNDKQKYSLSYKFQHIFKINNQKSQSQNNKNKQNNKNNSNDQIKPNPPPLKRFITNSDPIQPNQKSNNNQSQGRSQSFSGMNKQNEKFQVCLHEKHKQQYFLSLIESFSEYSSSTNKILNKALFPIILEKPLPYHQFYGEKMTHDYMNAIFKKSDLILQVYKIIVQRFPATFEELESIKNVTFDILGNDILSKNRIFQLITNEAYNYVYGKPELANIIQEDLNKNLSQDFLSTLFMIYDALYFMRNKTYYQKQEVYSSKKEKNDVQKFYEKEADSCVSSSKISQKEKPQISDLKIIDQERQKYFNSFIRHSYKDYFKELAYYYYNSIRMKHSTFTQRERLSYIGFLLIRDPKKRYTLN